jgi:hypothetical protein
MSTSKFAVLDPTGYAPTVTGQGLAQGLGTLDGRRIFLVDVGFENSDHFMVQLHAWFGEHDPAVRTELVRWRDQHEPDPELCERIRAEGDGAILGVGT